MACRLCFIKNIGRLEKSDFISSIQNFFSTGYLLKEWNTTFISLIPKKQNATLFQDFRPIILTNTTYKVISKIIANRFKHLLEKIISPNQLAIMEGRWINENMILAQEALFL